jgi:hypothetical protein
MAAARFQRWSWISEITATRIGPFYAALSAQGHARRDSAESAEKWVQLNCADSGCTIRGSGKTSAKRTMSKRLRREKPRPNSISNCRPCQYRVVSPNPPPAPRYRARAGPTHASRPTKRLALERPRWPCRFVWPIFVFVTGADSSNSKRSASPPVDSDRLRYN